ncbi:hypothetical protein N3K66_003173 [Trichothecium roseum]|uniref:Uncharacterized protein n=1 Tax=Trichothecium roseum TaxID=47278 RepID=A0ACC0V5Z6_9HYPO|nr:hypothetical protein N3K66_003173 [Trichothecium roseum]
MDSGSTWNWSSTDGTNGTSSGAQPGSYGNTTHRAQQSQQSNTGQGHSKRRYGSRSCRICFDVEHPKFPETSKVFGVTISSSKPTYTSDDPQLGRLLSPCKCKGSQKYVHEGCLDAWRLANPTENRNHWQCPTCKFTYRLARLHWASMLSNRLTQIGMTVAILILSIFVLGFIADPLFDLWFDPFGTVTEGITNVLSDIEAREQPDWEPPSTWSEHFAKGFFSLGLVGLVKSMFAMGPWQWFNIRSSFGSGRRQGTGRARAENMSWLFILIGAFTFLMAVWKLVQKISARVLKNVSDRVIDIGDEDDDDEDVGDEDKKDQ